MLLSITIAILFSANGVLAGECKDYNKCKKLAPTLTNHINYTCDMIVKKWQDTFDCLAKPGACFDVSGAGVLSGICQGYMSVQYYNKKLNCSSFNDDLTETICGTKNHANFNVSFNRDIMLKKCYKPYPSSCNETIYQKFQLCMISAAKNNFTKGVVQGMCENFRLQTTEKCSFSNNTCKVVSFTSGTGTATTIAPVPTNITTITTGTPISTIGTNITSKATTLAQTNATETHISTTGTKSTIATTRRRGSGGTSVIASLFGLINAVLVAYCLS